MTRPRAHRRACVVCGWLVDPETLAMCVWGWLLGRDGMAAKSPRWPQRKRTGVRCPECGWLNVVMQSTTRDIVEPRVGRAA